jgi:hypothetical protein
MVKTEKTGKMAKSRKKTKKNTVTATANKKRRRYYPKGYDDLFGEPTDDWKPGDRVKALWREGFYTEGYIMRVTRRGVLCKFPSHKKAQAVRWFPHDRMFIDSEFNCGVTRDVIGEVKKIMKD